MLWLRRISAVVLGLFFLGVFATATVTSTVNGVALDPSFYAEALREADAYNFVYDTAMPYAVERSLRDNDAITVDAAEVTRELVEAARKAVPPEWLQAKAEEALFQLMPYLSGKEEHFTLRIEIRDRVKPAADEAKRLLNEGVTFEALYQELTERVADSVVEDEGDATSGFRLQRNDVLKAVRAIVTREWLARQMGVAIDEVAAWVDGRAEHFTIRIPLGDRVDIAGQELKALLRTSDASRLVREELLDPLIDGTVESLTDLPYGIRVSQSEVREVLRQVLPDSWVRDRLDGLVDAVVAYMTGKVGQFSVTVPLADRREAAYQAIAALADAKLEAAYRALAQCGEEEFAVVIATLPPGQLPRCRPVGLDYQPTKRLVGINIEAAVRQAFAAQLPNAWTFGEAELRAMLGEDAWEGVKKVRTWVTEGYVYTDTDLRSKLDAGDRAALDRAVRFVREGGAFTDQDLREELAKGDQGEKNLSDLERARSALNRVRYALWLNWLVAVAFLAAIGLIGGTSWGSRLAWAGGTLTVVAAAWIILWLVLSGIFIDPQLWVNEAIETEDHQAQPMIEWVVSLVDSLVSTIANGIAVRSAIVLLLGVMVLALGVWLRRRPGRRMEAEVVIPGPG